MAREHQRNACHRGVEKSRSVIQQHAIVIARQFDAAQRRRNVRGSVDVVDADELERPQRYRSSRSTVTPSDRAFVIDQIDIAFVIADCKDRRRVEGAAVPVRCAISLRSRSDRR